MFLWVPGARHRVRVLGRAARPRRACRFRHLPDGRPGGVHGRSPYVAPNAAALAHFDKFVYPPVAALLFAPLAACRPGRRACLMFVAGLAALLGALRLLGVEGLALLQRRARLRTGDQLARAWRAHLVPAPRRGALLALPRPPAVAGVGDCVHCAPEALPLAARDLAPRDEALARGGDLRRVGAVLLLEVGGDRLRRPAQLPDARARPRAARGAGQLLGRRAPRSERARRDGRHGRALAGGRRRRSGSRPPGGRTATGAPSPWRSLSRWWRRRCSGCTTSCCSSSRSPFTGRGCRGSGSCRWCSG